MPANLKKTTKRFSSRLYIALGCYGALVLVGLWVMLPVRSRDEQFLLGLFLAVFAILAVKTVAHSNMEE
jgi:predicted membrane channel-forming protein YqfA (hemolysin III family)